MSYIPTIGLEIHVELNTRTKMFCRCVNDPFCRDPNIHICPVCLGLPGALPFPNQQAVLKTIQLGKVLNCRLASLSKWDRKNYFYPDLPKGYQISQYDLPLCRNGHLDIKKSEIRSTKSETNSNVPNVFNPPAGPAGFGHSDFDIVSKFEIRNSKLKRVRIRRIHLEEDTGKLLHTQDGYSLIDYNRSGVPLVELVTEPDIESAKQAKEFAQEIQLILRHIEISQADMEKGEMRVEANVSVKNQKSKIKNQKLGTKVEIKNLNSFRSVERAIEYELKRQRNILESAGKVVHETRGWDETEQITYPQRVKETEGDYRYFPEPDIPPLIKLKTPASPSGRQSSPAKRDLAPREKLKILELPTKQRERYVKRYGLTEQEAQVLVNDSQRSQIFDQMIQKNSSIAQAIAKLLINRPEIIKRSTEEIMEIAKLAPYLQKQALLQGRPLAEVSRHITRDNHAKLDLEELVEKILTENSKAVADYRSGKESAMSFLMGQLMKESKGKYEPKLVKEMFLNGLK